MLFRQLTPLEHARCKEMWAGSFERSAMEQYVYSKSNSRMIPQKINFTASLYKICDELIVNAIDHWTNNPRTVTLITVDFDQRTGRIVVTNDGPGIPIYDHETRDGRKMSSVQLISTELLTGSNFESGDRVTGGTNGAGMKLTNIHSAQFTLITIDAISRQYFEQTSRDRLHIVEPAIIVKLDVVGSELAIPAADFAKIRERAIARGDEYALPPQRAGAATMTRTIISFVPAYTVHGVAIDAKSGTPTHDEARDIYYMLITRTYQMAGFVPCAVQYNGIELKIRGNFWALASMYCNCISTRLTWLDPLPAGIRDLDWHVCVGISDGHFRHLSIINGVLVQDGGSHIDFIYRQIEPYIMTQLAADKRIKKLGSRVKLTARVIKNHMFILMRGYINKPSFDSQSKNKIQMHASSFRYTIGDDVLRAIWTHLRDTIIANILGKHIENAHSTRLGSVTIKKAQDAELAGTRDSLKCTLFICEGDSAKGTIHNGIVSKVSSPGISYKTHGWFSISGVPINALREVSDCAVGGDAVGLILSPKMKSNERIQSLVKILGLDYARRYKDDGDLRSLRYGRVIVATDQDEDGKGNIFGLILTLFFRCWPDLIARGFVCRLNTPIIRAIPRSKRDKLTIKEFYSTHAFDRWVDADHRTIEKKYEIVYYKGLGRHEAKDIKHMFRQFDRNVLQIELDGRASETMDIYFNKDSEKRKRELATPVADEIPDGLTRIDLSRQLDVDTKSYQRENIIRKLISCIDGQNPARRKIIYGARHLFISQRRKKMKVASFVNAVIEYAKYHHGEASLESTAVKMAQRIPGIGRQIPFLRDIGGFGTRASGCKDAASARYIETALNVELCTQMFPLADDPILTYNFDDSEQVEPKYFVPVLPLAVFETMEVPGHGWKIKVWARDFEEVVTNVRGLIEGKLTRAIPMEPSRYGFHGELTKINGKQVAIGTYTYDARTEILNITEVPPTHYSQMYVDPDYETSCLAGRPEVSGKIVDCTDERVDIQVKITIDKMRDIQKNFGTAGFKPVCHWAKLYCWMDSAINMVDCDHKVIHFGDYAGVIDTWFTERKRLYRIRIEREIILTRLRIQFHENIDRFSDEYDKYHFRSAKARDAAKSDLAEAKYIKFDHALLNAPKFTPTARLEELILADTSDGYDYLLDSRISDFLNEKCVKRRQKIVELKELLRQLLADNVDDEHTFPGKRTWLTEFDTLVATVREGLRTGWAHGDEEPAWE